MKRHHQNKAEFMSVLRKSALLTLLLAAWQVQGTPIMGPVLQVEGEANYKEPGRSEFAPLRENDRLQGGGTIETRSRVVFSPIPGSVVRLGSDARLVIRKLDREVERGQISSREASFRLDEGSLTFAIDELSGVDTTFQVETPRGVLSTRGTAGSVVLKTNQITVTVGDGAATFQPTVGAPVKLRAGSVLTAFASGQVVVQIVHLPDASITTVRHDGATATAGATPEHFQAAADRFQSSVKAAAASANLAASRGLMSSKTGPQIEGFAARIDRSPGSPVQVASSSQLVGTPGRLSSGLLLMAWPEVANPANTSGPVASPEQ